MAKACVATLVLAIFAAAAAAAPAPVPKAKQASAAELRKALLARGIEVAGMERRHDGVWIARLRLWVAASGRFADGVTRQVAVGGLDERDVLLALVKENLNPTKLWEDDERERAQVFSFTTGFSR